MSTVLLSGVILASIYALVALGYNIVLVASGAFNFAHAAIVTISAFLASQLGVTHGMPIPVVLLLGAAFGALIGAVLEVVALRPVVGRGSHGELVTTIGASTLILGVATRIYGEDTRPIKALVSSNLVTVFGARATVDALVLVATVVVLAVAIWAWSRFTQSGLACLAAAEDRDAALIRGVNVRRLSLLAVMASGALGGVSGELIGTQTLAALSVATVITVKSFVALTIGGFNSFPGALIGALAVGLTEALSDRYLGGNYSLYLLFALLMVLLLARPQGIFGRKSERFV